MWCRTSKLVMLMFRELHCWLHLERLSTQRGKLVSREQLIGCRVVCSIRYLCVWFCSVCGYRQKLWNRKISIQSSALFYGSQRVLTSWASCVWHCNKVWLIIWHLFEFWWCDTQARAYTFSHPPSWLPSHTTSHSITCLCLSILMWSACVHFLYIYISSQLMSCS